MNCNLRKQVPTPKQAYYAPYLVSEATVEAYAIVYYISIIITLKLKLYGIDRDHEEDQRSTLHGGSPKRALQRDRDHYSDGGPRQARRSEVMEANQSHQE